MMSSGGANNTHRPGQQDLEQDVEVPHRLDEASALQGWPQGPAQLAVQSGLLQASLLGGWTSNHNDIYVRRTAPAHPETDTNSILTLAGLQEEARSSAGGAPASLYILQGSDQVDFGSFMRQEAERLTGQHLTGVQLWQYRFDADTMAAAGAKQGQGTWQPAVVVAYDDTTGEHELEFTAASVLAGARSRVFLGACGIHFGDSPPAPGTAPNRTPPAHQQQQQQQQQQQVVKQEGDQAVTQEPAAAAEASPAADDASADGEQQAAASTEQQDDDRQSADAGGDVSAPLKLEPEPTEEAHNQQQQNGRGGSRRQAALAAPATWAQPSKQRKVGSADGAARRMQHAGDDRADSQADAALAAAAADGSKVSRKKPMQLAKRPQSAPAGQHVAAAAAAAAGSDGGAAAVAAAVPPRPNSNRRKQQRPPSRDGGAVDVEPVVPVLAEHPADRSIASARFKNVLWSKRANKWQATVSLAGRYRYFGLYTTQEEAACACDRASLVYKGVNAKVLYYPLITYLQPDQQQLLQALMQEAHIAASRGTMPPPKMPSGDAGVQALRAASDAQQAAAAAAGEVLQGPPESTLAAIRISAQEAVAAAALPPVETRPRRRGASSSNLVIGPEDWPAGAAAAAGPSRGDSGRRQQRGVSADASAGGAGVLRAGSEVGSLGTDGTEGDQGLTAGHSSMRQGRDEGDDSEQADVAAHQPAAAGDGRKRKRKLPPKQGPQKARKAAGGKAAGQAGAASRAAAAATAAAAAPTSTGSGGSPDVGQHGPDVSPAGEVSTATGADGQQGRASTADMMDLDKQQQAAVGAGAGAGAARRKPGGRSSASRHTTPESSVEPEAAGEGGDVLPAHGHATRRATGTLRASPGLHGRSGSRKPSPAQLSADKQHSGDSSDIGADGEGAEDDALSKGAAAAAATDSESGSDSEEDGEEGDEGAAAAASTRRSQRQAAKRAQRETRLRIASVHNARSDGVWGRLMQRAGGDAQEGSRQRLLMQPAADGDSSEEDEEAGLGRRHDATPAVKASKGLRASHPAHAAGVSPAGVAGAAAGVSHRPLTRSRTKTKGKGRQRHRPGSAASAAAAAAAARGQGRATLMSPGRQPLLAAMLAAVADALSDDDQQEDEETDEEAATVAAAAAAAAELRARELVEAVIEEAAAGFPNLPDVDGEEEEDVAQLLLDLNAAAAAAHSEDDGSSDGEHAEEGGGDQEDGEQDAAGHLVSGPAGEGKAAVRKKRRRERNSGFKYGDQEDWAPGRNRKRRGGKGRGGGPPGVPRSRGRPRSAVPAPPVTATAAGGMHAPYMGAFVPPAGFFSMAALQQQQQLADAAAAAGAAGVDSGSDSEDSDLVEGLTAEQRADRQAQKLIQAMTAAFSSGDQASMAQFARLYRRVARNPAAFSQTMAYVFQWGAQMGQNIAASGQSANSMAAAFSSMAAGMGPAGAAAAAAAAAAGRVGGAAAAAAAAPGARLRADLVNNRAAGATGAVGRQAHVQQQQQQRPGAAAAGVGAPGAHGSGHWMQQYAELLQTSGGSSSSSVVSDSEDGDARQAVTSSATTPAARADSTTAAAAGRSPSKLAAAAAAQAAAAVASLKASGGLKAKLPPVPPCFGTADPQTVRAMMGLPLGSSSSDSSSSDSDSGSDDFEIAALAAKAPRCDRVPLVFRSSGAGGPRRVSAAGAGVGSTAGGRTSPSTGGDVEMGDADGASRAATEGLEGAAAWPGAAAGFRGSIAGAGRVMNSQGPLQHPAKPAVVTAAASQQRQQMHVGYSAPGRGASAGRGRGRGRGRPPGKRQQHGSTQAAPAAAGMVRGYGNPGYVQPGGYSVVLPAGSYYGTALPQAVGGNWQQWQQMAGLQALQQQQQMYQQQQQQAYYYLPSQQQQLLLQQQQQAAARTAAVAFHHQQLLASQQAQKAAAPQQQQQQQQQQQAPPQLVLNLQQPATQLQPGQLLLSPNSAAKAAAARPAGGHVVGLNLAGPPTSSAPSSSTPPSAGAAVAPPDAAGTASAEGAAAVTSPTSQQQQQPEQEAVPVEPAAPVGPPAAPAAMVEG